MPLTALQKGKGRATQPTSSPTHKPSSHTAASSSVDDSSSDSDSDSESSSEDDDSDSDDQEQTGEAGGRKSRFLMGDSGDEDSDEDVKRVVKSAKDKRLDEMEATGKNMENALKINDWVAISNGMYGNNMLSPPLMFC